MRAFGLALAGCVILALATGAEGQDKDKKDKDKKVDKEPISKEKLLGTWETKEGFTVEFTKDGKLKLTAKVEDKTFNIEGMYTLDKDKLTTTLKQGDKEQKEVSTIKSVDDKKLVIVDKDGKTEELKRKK